jgi:hypothetical protein
MGKNIPTTKDLVDWLIDNPIKYDKRGRSKPTGVPDAAKALGYTGPPLKIREGNLTNGRENLRIGPKGKSSRSDYFRALAQAKTTPDKAERAAANSKIKQLNSEGLHGDHILTNSALANGEDFVRAIRGEEGVQQMRKSYKKVGGYGHSPGNIQGLTPEENSAKEIQERTLRGNNRNKTAYLQHLENKPPVSSPEFSKWDKKRQAFADKINEYEPLLPPPALQNVLDDTFKPKLSLRTKAKLAAAASLVPGMLGTAADAAETAIRFDIARQSNNPVDYLQAGISAATTALGATNVGDVAGVPLEFLNSSIDQHREGLPQIRGRSGAARASK